MPRNLPEQTRFPTTVEDVSPEWLTGVLRHAAALDTGCVAGVRIAASAVTAGSVVAHLALTYASAPAAGPSRLFLKLPRADRPPELMAAMGTREVRFYAELAHAAPALPTIRCYAALLDEASASWCLVLQDLGATHAQTEWPVPPPRAGCDAMVDALAALHAAWWEHPRLEEDLGSPVTPDLVRQSAAETADRVVRFLAFLGDRLSPSRRAALERVAAALPALWTWHGRRTAKTLVHGDAHAWNFLFPNDGVDAPVYLCDWQNWRVGVGAQDLATMMVLDWDAARRGWLEQDLLHRYHRRLHALGVDGYSWKDCLADYRLAAANALLTLPWRWDNGTPAQYWLPHLERALAAFEDLECAPLLASLESPQAH